MWPFKTPVVGDTTEALYLDETGLRYLPLQGDNEAVTRAVEKINDILRKWMMQDLMTTTENNQSVDDSLLYQLKEIDLKFLPFPIQLSTLERCMEDTELNHSGSRLMDAIVQISIEVPIEIAELIKGKFLYAQLFSIPRSINGIELPTKNDWLQTFQAVPWAHYLQFIQQLFDEDDIIKKLRELSSSQESQRTTITTTPDVPGGSSANS